VGSLLAKMKAKKHGRLRVKPAMTRLLRVPRLRRGTYQRPPQAERNKKSLKSIVNAFEGRERLSRGATHIGAMRPAFAIQFFSRFGTGRAVAVPLLPQPALSATAQGSLMGFPRGRCSATMNIMANNITRIAGKVNNYFSARASVCIFCGLTILEQSEGKQSKMKDLRIIHVKSSGNT
jgi:hypothetical protein